MEGVVNPSEQMTLRLIIMLTLLSAFCLAFAELAKRYGGTVDPPSP
jgi:hypothetical protein